MAARTAGDLRRRIYEILERGTAGDRMSLSVDRSIIALIYISLAAVVLESTRYSPAMRSLLEVIYSERRALIGCFVILLGTTLIASALLHLAEGRAQPDKLGTIPDAMGWAIVALGTIGYGDVVPILHALMERDTRLAERVRQVARIRIKDELVTPKGDIVSEELEEDQERPIKT
jgi:uncharacterized membrane protein YidH (DUF202 family)